MPPSDDPRALLGARVFGLLILAFALVLLLEQLTFAWCAWVLDGSVELGRKLARTLIEVIIPTAHASWVFELIALAFGSFMLARARGPARPAALIAGILASVFALLTFGVVTVTTGRFDAELFDRIESLVRIAWYGAPLIRVAAIAAVVLLARGRPQARAINILAGVACLGPLLTIGRLAELELLAPLAGETVQWSVLLGIAADICLGIAFLKTSVGADDRSLDDVAARGLELARSLVFVRVGLAIVSVVVLVGATRSSDGTAARRVIAGLGQLQSATDVGFALALVLLALRPNLRERLLGGLGGLVALGLSRVGAGLALAHREALLSPSRTVGYRLENYQRVVSDLYPYLGVATLVGSVLCVIALMRIGDRGQSSDRVSTRGIRLITVTTIASLVLIFGRDVLAELGKGVYVFALLALVAGILAIVDLTALLRMAAQSLRGELEEPEPEAELAQW